MIHWEEVIIGLCTLLITGVLVPLIRTKWQNAKMELDQNTQDIISFWTSIAVKWAKQWLQSETGEKKKEEVLAFVSAKMQELKIDVTTEELDKIIEAVYSEVKNE